MYNFRQSDVDELVEKDAESEACSAGRVIQVV